MKLERQIEHLQAQRASEWFEILKKGRPEDLAAFRDWCRRSPLHIQEFLEITWTDRSLDDLDPDRQEDLESLLQEISVRVAPWHSGAEIQSPTESETSSLFRPWALAATLVVCTIGLALYARSWISAETFLTQVGEQRTVQLGDSSVMTMNTDSDIAVQFASNVRDVQLRRGEVVFKVAHDPARPFRVHTRAGVIQAVGTQFNVYDRADGMTDVVVMEGRVRLMPRSADGSRNIRVDELAAGEEAQIAMDGSIHRAAHADIARVIAWSKRRLKFDNTPLEEMVLEFNRYHRSVQMRIEGVPANSHHYSGIFDADDPAALARLLEQEPDLIVEHVNGDVVIRHRTEPKRLPGSTK